MPGWKINAKYNKSSNKKETKEMFRKKTLQIKIELVYKHAAHKNPQSDLTVSCFTVWKSKNPLTVCVGAALWYLLLLKH